MLKIYIYIFNVAVFYEFLYSYMIPSIPTEERILTG